MAVIDLHQHLWPEPLVEALRDRTHAPYLRGWTLQTAGEPAAELDPRDHDVARRLALDADAGVDLACVSLSAPLGIEHLPPEEAAPLLDAWHDGAATLPDHFAAWASVSSREPDLAGLAARLDGPFVGLQLPADALGSPEAWLAVGEVLRVAELADRPVLVHPGPVPAARRRPARVVGAGGRLRRAAPGGVVGLARARRAGPLPRPARGVRRRRRTGAPAARAAGGTRGPRRRGRPRCLRRHLLLRPAGARRPDPGAGPRRPGARQRPALRRSAHPPARRRRHPAGARRQPAAARSGRASTYRPWRGWHDHHQHCHRRARTSSDPVHRLPGSRRAARPRPRPGGAARPGLHDRAATRLGGVTTWPSPTTTASTSRSTATPTSTCGCCAGPRRTTPASTTTTSPPVRWRSSTARWSSTTWPSGRTRSRPSWTADPSSASAPTTSTGSPARSSRIGLGARLQPAAVADGAVLRRRRRAAPPPLRVVRRRAAADRSADRHRLSRRRRGARIAGPR